VWISGRSRDCSCNSLSISEQHFGLLMGIEFGGVDRFENSSRISL